MALSKIEVTRTIEYDFFRRVVETSAGSSTLQFATPKWAFLDRSDLRLGIFKDSDMGHNFFLIIDRVTCPFSTSTGRQRAF